MSSSNIDEINAWLDDVVESINFTMPGVDSSLGRDLAATVAEGIADRSVPDAKDPDGGTWADNKEPYKSRKAAKYDAYQPGILTGQMLSLESLKGETAIGADTVEMRYGTNEVSKGTRSGAPVPKAKNPATDREKGGYFTDSGREFYGLDDTIADACVDLATKAVDLFLGS